MNEDEESVNLVMRKVKLSEHEVELLVGLGRLRYLSTSQICSVWYSPRPAKSAERRLRELRAGGLLRSVQVPSAWMAWRLAGEAVVRLRKLRDGTFDDYRDVSATFLPHMVETNDVCLMLAGGEWLWERLPFTWSGSHQAVVPFEVQQGLRREARELRPDAIIAPKRSAQSAARVFLELDRSTECIRERDGRRSITGKLKAYKAVCGLPALGGSRTPYEHKYADGLPPRVVFALSKDPGGQRARAIAAVAADVAPMLDVQCVRLGDRDQVRRVCSPGGAPWARPLAQSDARQPQSISRSDVRRLTEFYKGAVRKLQAGDAGDELRRQASDARQVLQRLNRTTYHEESVA